MIEEYLAGTIAQLEQRAGVLKKKIPRDLPRDYQILTQNCESVIDDCIDTLRHLRDDQRMKDPRIQPVRIREFQRCVVDLNSIEATGIAALNKATDDDHRLNKLLFEICREIQYKGSCPVVSTLSKDFFYIITGLNLLCVPLVEGHFLLHLPCLYHELTHRLFISQNDKIIEPLQQKLAEALGNIHEYINSRALREDRRKGPVYLSFFLEKWRNYWAKSWAEELFCDLFGTYTLGPAYAWTFLHLVFKTGGNPFDLSIESHPADFARMSVILKALDSLGFTSEGQQINDTWQGLIIHTGFKPQPEYQICYPEELLDKITILAFEGIGAMGTRIAHPETKDPIHSLLNMAWIKFWDNPIDYVDWEEQQVKELLDKFS